MEDEEVSPCRRLSNLADKGATEEVRAELERLSERRGSEEVARDIVTCDFGKRNSLSSIHSAALHGHAEILELLLEANADANATDDTGNTPLHFAAELGHAKAVHILLQYGSEKSVKNNFGRMPTEKITINTWDTPQCKAGKAQIEQLFKGTSWEALPPETEQPQVPASQQPEHPSIVVLAPFANPMPEDMDLLEDQPDQSVPLGPTFSENHLAPLVGDQYASSEISTAATLQETEGDLGTSPGFVDLVRSGNTESVRSHLEDIERQGGRRAVICEVSSIADTMEVARSQMSSLHVAAAAGHVEVLELLLTTRADPSLADDAGNTLLHAAAGLGHEDIVEVLLEAGADPTWKNNFGRSPRALGQPQEWDDEELQERKIRLCEALEAAMPNTDG